MASSETIFALSSGGLPSGVAIIRLSGHGVRFALETFCGTLPKARIAVLKSIRNRKGHLIDNGLVLFFPAPHSFTGEDCAEFQIHGGRATVAALLRELGRLAGFRLAGPGEFTRRALDNGRMDLTSVEGLSDLIRAETEAQRIQALNSSEGYFRTICRGWADRILHARALIEAELDFSDEDDVPGAVSDRIWSDMRALLAQLSEFSEGYQRAEMIRDGYRVALVGPPNAGKSSLLNALAKRDVAIVSDEAGTTRDIVEVRLDLGGNLVVLQDTAGLRAAVSAVEQEGIRRSMEAARSAHLVLLLSPADAAAFALPVDEIDPRVLVKLRTKIDLDAGVAGDSLGIGVSAKTGSGLNALLDFLQSRAQEAVGTHDVLPARERHVLLLQEASAALQVALRESDPIEIRSESLRVAADAIGRITGKTDVEDLLGVIFSEFCIGK